MDINVVNESLVELKPSFTDDELKERSLAKRIDAFGQLARFMQRPRPDEIEIVQTQKRVEPFWYGAARSRYCYSRRHRYDVPVAPEVQSITVYDHEHPVQVNRNRVIQFDAIDHCVEENRREIMLDASRGDERDFSRYLSYERLDVSDIQSLAADGTVVIPPEVRSSFVVRKLVPLLMKTFQADQIEEEHIDVETITLFYHPIFAVEYHWKTKDKRAVVEFDGLTGEARAEAGQIKKQVVKVLENDVLFDIGADAIGTVFPGVNVAVKLGRFAARKVVK